MFTIRSMSANGDVSPTNRALPSYCRAIGNLRIDFCHGKTANRKHFTALFAEPVNFMAMKPSALIVIESSSAARNPLQGNVRALIGSFTVVLVICLGARAQDNSVSLPGRLEALVDARFKVTKCPGLSVAVASKNKTVFSKALGVADLEQGVPLRTDSVHRLASLSKPITGTIIMDLVEQGKLALDVSVRQYLPEMPETYQRVTLRHLLTHQAGVRGYSSEADVAFSVTHYPTSRGVLKTFMAYPLMFEPGTKTEYSSLSFTVLAAAAEAVTGRAFQQLAADFFAKHGLRPIRRGKEEEEETSG